MGGVGLGIPTIAYAVNTGTGSEDKMHWPVARGGSGKGDTTPSDVDPVKMFALFFVSVMFLSGPALHGQIC